MVAAMGQVAAQESAPNPDSGAVAPAAAEDNVARWIRELDDSHFVTRRNATEHLIEAGQAAVAPLRETLLHSNLEVATRGIYVLKSLALSKDVATQEAASEALDELAQCPARTTARQAATTLAALGEVRQQQALKELEDLGARISLVDRVMAFAPTVGLSVEIGPTWQGTVQDLQRFRWLTDVHEVSFVGRQITDEWVRSVEGLSSVERVLIKNARITNDAVKSLSKLKRVTKIDLMYSPVNDAALEYLKGMKTVREVRLYGTDVTRAAVEQYQAAVTQVTVDFKMGAFLGVMCQQAPFPCQVVEVVPDSAAANGGVQVQDIIVRYGGHPIASFDDLRQLIGKNKVGDSVLIQVARGGMAVVATVPQRGELQLGLEVEPLPFGCKVKKLSSDGAAAKAGLVVDDIITELNGDPVNSIETLSKAFTPLQADARLEFGVLRNSRIVSVRVTFGEWTESGR